MRTWICRILTVVFLFNTLPVQVFATNGLSQSINYKKLEQQVSARALDSLDNARLQGQKLADMLASGTLSPIDYIFVHNCLRVVSRQIDFWETIFDDKFSGNMQKEAERAYDISYRQLELSSEILHKISTTYAFYQEAESIEKIGAAVGAMHDWTGSVSEGVFNDLLIQHEYFGYDEKTFKARSEYNYSYNNIWNAYDKWSQDCQHGYGYDSSPIEQTPRKQCQILPIGKPNVEVVNVFEDWKNNKITFEDLIDLIDPLPLSPKTTNNRSEAIAILIGIFSSLNNDSELAKDDIDFAVDIAKHLKPRLQYLIAKTLTGSFTVEFIAQQKIMDLSSAEKLGAIPQETPSLLTLYSHVNNFLKQHWSDAQEKAALQADNKNIQGDFNLITNDLWYGAKEYEYIKNWSDLSTLQKQLKDMALEAAEKADPDDASNENMLSIFEGLITYWTLADDFSTLRSILSTLNKDGNTLHGDHEDLISVFFTGVYIAIFDFYTPRKTQQAVKNLLYDFSTSENAVNVRFQALALAAMLAQAATKGTMTIIRNNVQVPQPVEVPFLQKDLFSDESFREEMAKRVVDIYAPSTGWNAVHVSRKYWDQQGNPRPEKYGLEYGKTRTDDSLTQFSDRLALIFEGFLPLWEPVKITQDMEGQPGCWQYMPDLKKLQKMQSLSFTSQGGIRRERKPLDEDGNPIPDKECTYGLWYGDNTDLVYGHLTSHGAIPGAEHIWAMTKTNPANVSAYYGEMGEDFLKEVVIWYLWGGAFKVVGYLWKMGKAALLATKVFRTAAPGMRMARYSQKYAQLMKFSTEAWQSEMGIVNIVNPTKTARFYEVTLARPGFQSVIVKIPAEGVNLTTKGGRLAFQKAIRRELDALAKAEVIPQATSQTFRTTMTREGVKQVTHERAFQKAVQSELGRTYSPVVNPDGSVMYSVGNPALKTGEGLTTLPGSGTGSTSLFGKQTGAYAGELFAPSSYVSEAGAKTMLSYNMAGRITSGIVAEGGLSPAVIGRYTFNRFLPGTTRFIKNNVAPVFVMRTTTDPLFAGYYKSWQERVEEEQRQFFAKEYGIDLAQMDENTAKAGMNFLDLSQTTPYPDSDLFATFYGGFTMLNNGINNTLEWAGLGNSGITEGRRNIFRFGNSVREWIDKPLEWMGVPSRWTQELPTPGAIFSMPFVLTGDMTTNHLRFGSATDYNYQQIGFNQRYQKAEEGHNRTITQDDIEANIDAEINGMKADLVITLHNSQLTDYLKALPDYEQRMQAIYDKYINALIEIKELTKAEPDAQKALKKFEKLEEKAYAVFCEDSKQIITEAVHAFLLEEKANWLNKELTENFYPLNVQNDEEKINDVAGGVAMVTKKNVFTDKDEKKLKELFDKYYEKIEKAAIARFTAHLDPKKKPEAVKKKENEMFEKEKQLYVELDKEIQKLLEDCLASKTGRMIKNQTNMLHRDENTIGSLDNFLATKLWDKRGNVEEPDGPTYETLLRYIDNGVNQMRQLYSTFEQTLANAQKKLKKNKQYNVEAWQQAAAEIWEKFDNQRMEMMLVAIEYYADAQMEAELDYEMALMNANAFATQADKDEMTKLIQDHWGALEPGAEIVDDYGKGAYREALLTLYEAQEWSYQDVESAAKELIHELDDRYQKAKEDIRERTNRLINERMQERQAY